MHLAPVQLVYLPHDMKNRPTWKKGGRGRRKRKGGVKRMGSPIVVTVTVSSNHR
jgi:hypothetical protein